MSDFDKRKAELVSLCDDAVEAIRLDENSPLEDFFDLAERLNTTDLDGSGCIRDGLLGLLRCVDIATYGHPDIAQDLKLGMKIMLLALVEAGASVLGEGQTIKIERAVREGISNAARKAADAKHNKPGGSRELTRKIREVWATGKYGSRDACADKEWERLGFGSHKAARKSLSNTPSPPRCAERAPPARSGNS